MAVDPRELRRRPEAFERNLPHPTHEQIRGSICDKIQQLLENPNPSLHHLFTLNGDSDRTAVYDAKGNYLGLADRDEVQEQALRAMSEFGFNEEKHLDPELEDHGKREKIVYPSGTNPNLLFVRVRDQSYDKRYTYTVAWFVLHLPQN